MAVVLETTGESFSLVRIQPGAFSSHRSNTSPGARGQLTVADEVAEESPHSNRSAARRKPGGREARQPHRDDTASGEDDWRTRPGRSRGNGCNGGPPRG